MTNPVLIGATEVENAGRSIRSAAETMERAASNMQYALETHQRFLDDWLQRFQAAVDQLKPLGN